MSPTAQLLIAALCVSSVVVWLTAAGRWRGASLDAGGDPLRTVPDAVAMLPCLWLALQFGEGIVQLAGGAESAPFDPHAVLRALRTNCAVQACLIGFLVAALTRMSPAAARQWGLSTARPADFGRGLLAVTFAWWPVFAMLLITMPLRTNDREHSILRMLRDIPTIEAYFWATLAAVILAPLFEELLFRVILQTWLCRRIGPTWGIVTTAALFSLVHGFPDALPLLPFALILGLFWRITGSYWTLVTAHALFNATMLLLESLTTTDL